MNDSKGLLQSKSIYGFIAAALAMLARYYDVQIAEAEINSLILQLVELGGLLFGVYGRITAKKKIDRLL